MRAPFSHVSVHLISSRPAVINQGDRPDRESLILARLAHQLEYHVEKSTPAKARPQKAR